MRKETILAIFAGISIGVIFAFGSWKIFKNIKRNNPISTTRPTPAPKIDFFVSLDKPNNFDVLIGSKTIFSGLTYPLTRIIIATEEKDFLTKSKPDGSFEKEIELPEGLNEIKLINLNAKDQNNKSVITLVYSPDFSEQKATSYIGTVTDISDKTIQLKDSKDNIKQISVEDNTKYINDLKKSVLVKSTDLAIGDYIVAMGLINGNKVLKTQRILITSPIEENKFEAKLITIEKLSKTKINDITLPKKWIGPNVKDLEIGQEIIVVGLQNEDKFDLRSIFVIE